MSWKESGQFCTLTAFVKDPIKLQVVKELVDDQDKLTGFLQLHDGHHLVVAKLNSRYRSNQAQGFYKCNTVLDVVQTSGQPTCIVLVSHPLPNLLPYTPPHPQERVCVAMCPGAQPLSPSGHLISLARQPLQHLLQSSSNEHQAEPLQVSTTGPPLQLVWKHTFLGDLRVTQEQVTRSKCRLICLLVR